MIGILLVAFLICVTLHGKRCTDDLDRLLYIDVKTPNSDSNDKDTTSEKSSKSGEKAHPSGDETGVNNSPKREELLSEVREEVKESRNNGKALGHSKENMTDADRLLEAIHSGE